MFVTVSFSVEPAEEAIVVNINDRLPLVFCNPLMAHDDTSTEVVDPVERWAMKRMRACFSKNHFSLFSVRHLYIIFWSRSTKSFKFLSFILNCDEFRLFRPCHF